MKHRKYYGRKILSFLIALALTAGMCLFVGNTTYAEGEGFTLGAFNYTDGKFDSATGNDGITSTKYKSLLIAYGEAPNSGESLTLPTVDGFDQSDSASTHYSTVINMEGGKTPSEIAEYVKGITFTGSADHLGQTIMVTISDIVIDNKTFYFEGTGHYYQYVPFESNNRSWFDGYNAAKNMTYAGRKGYLATITSLEEDKFIYNSSKNVGWLGGTTIKASGTEDMYSVYDVAAINEAKTYDNSNNRYYLPMAYSEKYWYWACGPESGEKFYTSYVKTNTSDNDSKNAGYYFNWRTGGEPSNSANFTERSDENALTTLPSGTGYQSSGPSGYSWNDIPYWNEDSAGDYSAKGYFVEYGDETYGDSGESDSNSLTDTAKLKNPDVKACIINGDTTTTYTSVSDAMGDWGDGTTLRLYDDYTPETTISVTGSKVLDLNGYGISKSGDGSVISVSDSGTELKIIDSSPTVSHKYTITNNRATVDDNTIVEGYKTFTGGYITGGKESNGAGINITAGSVTMEGGTIIGNESGSDKKGAGVYIASGASFTMNGGTIRNNIATGNSADDAGAVSIDGGTFNMSGGKITSNAAISESATAPESVGGVSYVSGTFNVSGKAQITENKKIYKNSNNEDINVDSNAKLKTDQKINVDGKLDGASIAVTVGDTLPYTFTSGFGTYNSSSDPSKYFSYDGESKIKVLLDEQGTVKEAKLGEAYILKYDANGGDFYDGENITGAPAKQFYNLYEQVTVRTGDDVKKTDYKFGGWATGTDATADGYVKYEAGQTFNIGKDTTLYAVWEETKVMGVEASGYEDDYDGQPHSITVVNPEGTTVKYRTTDTGDYNLEVAPTYTDAGTYTVYYKVSKEGLEPFTGSEQVIIYQKPITIGIKDKTKEYGSEDPAITKEDCVISYGSLATDSDTISVTRQTGDVVGIYKYTGVSIKNGNKDISNNYIITKGDMGSLTITPKTITIDGITANSRIYNGTTEATLNYPAASAWKVGDDAVTLSATGEFKDKNAGTGKDVIISDIKLSGAADVLKNYKLAETGQQTSCKADITKKSVTVSGITANSKPYDGTNAATLDTSKAVITGKIEGDKLSVTASGAFADAEIGDNKTVNISNLKLTGEDADNYVIDTSVSQTTGTANITKPQITISGIKAVDRAYNGNNSATLDFSKVTYTGKLEGDTVSVNATGTFVDKNVGKDKRVAISELELTGKDAGKYELAAKGQQYSTTASITKRPVTISQISASDKVYDGTTDVTLDKDKIIIGGKIDDDVLDVVVKGGFADKNIGEDKDIIVDKKSIQLSGADADNYELNLTDFKTDSLKASITPRPVTISGITVKDKVYDGTTDVEFDYAAAAIGNKVENDKLSFTATGALADKNVGVDKSVSINDIELAGEDKANYVLAEEGQQTECMAKVTAKEITVSGIEAKDKGYDGKTEAEFTYDKIVITGLVENDKLTVAAEGEFSGKDSGSDKTVSISKITLAGEDAANYVLAKKGQQTECKADIKVASVLVSGITAESREYDGKATAELNLKDAVISGVAEGDRVSVSATGVYEDEYVGTGKKVAIKGMQLTGKDAANYELAEEGQQTECIADINKRVLTITGLKPVDKVYDGTDQVTFADDEVVTEGKLEDDKVTVKVKGTYTDGESGEAKKITITDVALGGRDGDNYVVDKKSLSATFTSNINIVNSAVEQVTNKDGSVTYNETSYNDVGKEERTVATTVDAKGDITQMVVKEAEGGEIVITDASEVTYGGSKETVEEVVAYIKNNKKENAEKGSVLYDNAVTPEKMAFILKDNKATTKILNDALQAGNDSTRTGGANVIVKGMDSKLDTDKAEVLKLALTPTEIVEMLSSAKTTDIVLELKENTSKEGTDKAADSAKAKLSELVKNDEEYYYFDCDMYKVVSGSNVKTGLTEFASKIKISFPLPEKLRAKNRSFRVIASHMDKTTGALSAYEIPCKVDNAYNLSFETDKLCLMTLAYTDEAIKARAMTVAPEVLEANTLALNEGLKIDQTGSKLNVVWGKVDKAENYDVFVQYCGKNFSSTPEKTVNGNTVKATVTKINGKKLNLKKNYKIYVVAYKVVDGKKVTLAKTITGHVVGRKNTKYSNAKSIKLKSGTKITLKKGKTSKIKAKTVLVAKGKKQLSDAHAKEFRYASSDKKVATVSSKGKIKAVGKGSCTIYVYSRNGYTKKVSVTVK